MRASGAGPPLLLLHGFPQTHLMWHAVAPRLAEGFTVVAADLPGYGDSFRRRSPRTTRRTPSGRSPPTSSRRWPRSATTTFAVAGHDRGGRVAYRMALDHPAA